jgi:16S rRNA (cytidine1402-2'-O)-methyltransferase
MTTRLPGTLLLVPNTLDLGATPVDIRNVLPDGVIRDAARLVHWVAEDAKTARAFLKRVDAVVPLAQPLQAIEIHELPRPRKGPGAGSTPAGSPWRGLLAPALAGHDLGLLSEAGLPAVADPGAGLVAAAHAAGIPVRPLPGPSSLMLALAASGLNGQCFAFVGYLPQESGPRAARIRELENRSRKERQTQLVIETPYRNAALLQALTATLSPQTRLALACGLTLADGFVRSGTVEQWRRWQIRWPERAPAVFALLADS